MASSKLIDICKCRLWSVDCGSHSILTHITHEYHVLFSIFWSKEGRSRTHVTCMHGISFQSYALQKYHVFISMMSIFNIQMEWTHENHSCNWAALRKETFLRTKNFLWWRAPESRLFGVKRGKQIASSNQLTSYLTKDSQNWFYKPSFSRKGITYCTFLWKHGTF